MSEEAEQLMHAIYEQRDLEALKLYITKGYDVCAQHQQQQGTLLHRAVLMEGVDQLPEAKCVPGVLIDRGIAVDARDEFGRTALMLCRSVRVAKLLISFGANVNYVCNQTRTALHYRALDAHSSLVRSLLTAGASAAAVCGKGETPLALACTTGNSTSPAIAFSLYKVLSGRCHRVFNADGKASGRC
jgi:ankyrin repeat protein